MNCLTEDIRQIQLVFQRGAKKIAQPKDKLVTDKSGILTWKENDRAIASFKDLNEIQENILMIKEVITKWIELTA